MSYLRKDELDKYLKDLPRTNNNNQQGAGERPLSSSRPATGGNLKGPRPARKPASWRTSNETSSNSMQDARNDLIYPMQRQLRLSDYNETSSSSSGGTSGIQPEVKRLQQATGTIATVVAEQSQQTASSSVTSPKPNRVGVIDAFEASLAPRRRQQTTSPTTATTPTVMAPTTVTPPAVQPKPISTETKPVFPRVTPTNTSNNSSFPPPIPSKPPVTASPTSTSSSRPLPPPVPAKKSSAPPVPSTPKPPVIASSPPVTNNDRVSVANPLYTGIGCAGCKKPIAGSIITVGQNKWHVDCFKCKHCKQDLEHVAFYSMDGQPYCALDYHELFSKRCDYCNTPIEDQSIEALGKFYHVGHFFCRGCSKPFDATSSFMVHDGHPYCEKDYQAKFGHKCMGCGEYIAGEIVGALGGEWHKDCFVCSDCGQSFESVTFYERNNKPFCEIHYKNPLNSNAKLCQQCGVAIDGRYSSAFGKEYHPHHFQCARCSKILSVRVPGMWQEGAPGELICKMCGRK